MVRKTTTAVVKTYNKNAREHIHEILRTYLDTRVVNIRSAACLWTNN